MIIQDTHTFESDEGFDAVKYAEVCIFSETVNENGRMKESKEGRRECKHYTKIVHKVRSSGPPGRSPPDGLSRILRLISKLWFRTN